MPGDEETLGRLAGELREHLAAAASTDSRLAAMLDRLTLAAVATPTLALPACPERDWPAFASGLTHSLRNAMFALAATADLLALSEPHAPSLPPAVPTLRHQVARVLRILADLDAFAVAAQPPTGSALLTSLLRDAKAAVEPLAAERSVAVVEYFPTNSTSVPVQPRTLGRAVHSLLETAILRSPPGTSVDLAERPTADDGAEISIADAGEPLQPALLARALTPFAVRSGEMTGLSYALAHRVANAHGGRLSLANRPERGIIVSLFLPQAKESQG